MTASATRLASTESGPSTGKSLSTTRSFGSLLTSVWTSESALFAVAAIVVEELDQGDVGLRVADDDRVRRVRGVALRFSFRAAVCATRCVFGLPLLELRHDLLEKLGILQEVFPDDLADRLLLLIVERRRLGRSRSRERERRRATRSDARWEAHGNVL